MSKRLFDFIASSLALLSLSPLLACIMFMVRLQHGAPVHCLRVHPDMNGTPFCLLKFRTMTDSRCENGSLLSDAEPRTRFRQFLRSSRLDELPSLWNIINGVMSLVEAEGVAVRGVKYSLGRLHSVHAHVFGVILTKLKHRQAGYGYGYGYGYGSSENTKAKLD
jgi:lipopolysaccharide/colanic/teichoic acid biosynthesis glycosyltransferase